MHKLLFFISLSLFLFSCKKEHTLHIKAINAVTGMGYSGLSYSIKGTRTGSDGEKIVFTYNGTLNTNGEDFPTIKIKENLTYHIGCKEPANICYTKDINFFWDVKANPSPTFQFEYAPCANLKLNISNVNCEGPNDLMNFQYRNSYNEFNGWSTDRLGCYSYVSDYNQLPSGWIIYEWRVNRNGIITNFMDSIFLNENEYGTFNLFY